MAKTLISTLLALLLFQPNSTAQYLQKIKGLSSQNKLLKFSFTEEYHELGHLASPWATNSYKGKGDFWLSKDSFFKHDTLMNSRDKSYFSKTELSDNMLLYLDYGDDKLMPITEDNYFEKLINTAKYSPATVYHEFLKREKEAKLAIEADLAIYSLKIGKYTVNLTVNTTHKFVESISYLSYDELYGDVNTTFIYSDYITKDKISYPSVIKIEKINGKVIDSVKVLAVTTASIDFKLLEKPIAYAFAEPKKAKAAKIDVKKYNDYIHFIDLEHTDDKVMVVEFDEYVLVAEAPINPSNGEIIIAEVKKIAPTKPIKYFVFGHHHPHYLGGLRAFVHKNATILCTEMSKDYVTYIANAPHTLQTDSLALEPIPLKTQVVKDSLLLGDNGEMKIYFIGEKSAHTYDYLIYYFPKDQLLFQDDLCWIAKEGPITKAGARQIGLYNAIQDLGLKVETIIQSWPVTDYKVKTTIPFSDLEKSVLIEK